MILTNVYSQYDVIWYTTW